MQADKHIVRIEGFEGPLDLLLFLVRRDRMEITTLSLAAVTDDFIATVEASAEDLDPDMASHFLEMAAMLARHKARTMLETLVGPEVASELDGEEEEDEFEQVRRRLLWLQEFKRIAREFSERDRLGRDVFAPNVVRDSDAVPFPAVADTGNLSIFNLARAYHNVMERHREWSSVPEFPQLRAEQVKVYDCMCQILGMLQSAGRPGPFCMKDFVNGFASSLQMTVASFLASLELARQGIIEIRQAEAFGPIEYWVRADVKNLSPQELDAGGSQWEFKVHGSVVE